MLKVPIFQHNAFFPTKKASRRRLVSEKSGRGIYYFISESAMTTRLPPARIAIWSEASAV